MTPPTSPETADIETIAGRLEALADRCEAATGPDRRLDRAIMRSLKLAPDYSEDWGPRDNCKPAPFRYTASLDAAMTLVPEDSRWTLGNYRSPRTVAVVGSFPQGSGATPALAMCAAALHARAAHLRSGDPQ